MISTATKLNLERIRRHAQFTRSALNAIPETDLEPYLDPSLVKRYKEILYEIELLYIKIVATPERNEMK